MNNTSNKIYEVIRNNNKFYVKSYRIVNKNKTYIYTSKLTFEIGKLNKFIKLDYDNLCLYNRTINNYGFTTNKDLAKYHCCKYNLLLEMQVINYKLNSLFEKENYLAKQKQKSVELYNKTQQLKRW